MTVNHPFLGPKLLAIDEITTSNKKQTDTDNNKQNEFKDTLLKFLLTFNVFESEFFEEPKYFESNDKDKKPVWKRCKDIQKTYNKIIRDNTYQSTLSNNLKKFQHHFRSVYIDEDGNRTFRFASLQENKEISKKGYSEQNMKYIETFLKSKYENEHAVENALSLCYKFRNNLFHGEKSILYLEKYNEDFNAITKFLISLMKYLAENNADKF